MNPTVRAEVAALIASAEAAPAADITTDAELLTRLAALKKAAATNATQRLRHADAPERFMQSELALDDAIRALAPVAVQPSLYPFLAAQDGLRAIASLLSHDNDDIVHRAVALLHDLAAVDGDADDSASHRDLHAALLTAHVPAALVDALAARLLPRARSADADERAAAQEAAAQVFSLFENVLDTRPDLAAALADSCAIVDVCIAQVRASPPNAAAVELLAVLLQDSAECKALFWRRGGIDALLEALAPFRKRSRRRMGAVDGASRSAEDTHDEESKAEQSEMVENMFGLLCSTLLGGEAAKAMFLKLDGVELMVSFMKRSFEHRTGSAKVLDFACTGYGAAVDRLLACGGLGVVFAVLQTIGEAGNAKPGKRRRTASEENVKMLTEHVFGILFSAFRYADDEGRKRLLFKFWEDDGSKARKVVLLYRHFAQAVEDVTGERGRYLLSLDGAKVRAASVDGDDRLLDRLDAGLFIVQMGAALIAHVMVNGLDDLRDAMIRFLPQVNLDFATMDVALKEYAESIDDGEGADSKQEKEKERLRMLALSAGMEKAVMGR